MKNIDYPFKEEGVSLNTLVISLLAADVGYKKA